MPATDLSMTMPMSVTAPKGRILCVDDEPNILRALGWLLQKEFEVITAAGGQEALELVRRDDFDVVISDHRMPGMSGVDLLRQVRLLAPRSMRILLTGYSDLDAVLQSVNESEIFRYVTKPWNVNELPRIVAQAAEIARGHQDWSDLPVQPAAPEPKPGEAKILVLDDDLDIHNAVEACAGDLAEVVHVTNIAEAIHHLHEDSIGVIVAETALGSVDLTRLICFLKQRHPQVVSVVLAEEAGADTVMKLVNQGQVFRVVAKPVQSPRLRETLRAALGRSSEIKQRPGLARRYQVEELPMEELGSLRADIEAATRPRASSEMGVGTSFGQRMTGIFRRFFMDAENHA